ncbi:hypothetical protein ACLH0K_08845 [Arthrobacter sp. MPF02]|uniref:hypothetical protein n=1 Tax=Arthrobacter sp. MPF02 TaxID=3388492 RepID=UPI0039853A5C
MVKGSGQPYEGGVRQWLKVKHRQDLHVVCAAVIGQRDRPTAIIAGLPIEGRLWIVGRSVQLTAAASKALAAHLHIPRENHPWPEEIVLHIETGADTTSSVSAVLTGLGYTL